MNETRNKRHRLPWNASHEGGGQQIAVCVHDPHCPSGGVQLMVLRLARDAKSYWWQLGRLGPR